MNFEVKYRSDGSWYVVVPQTASTLPAPLQPSLNPLQTIGRALRKPIQQVKVIKP